MEHDPDLAEVQSAFKRGDLARARAIAEARLAREPDLPLLQHLLGLIHCRRGNMDAGIACLTRAVDGEPGNAAYRVMLARALTDSGRAEQALEIATPPGGTSPPELALWHARAEAAQKASDYASAAEAWRVLSSARPDDWRSWANYGDALAGLDRWPDAANALRRAWTLNPTELPIQWNFAAALTKAGFYTEAADQLLGMLDGGVDDMRTRLTLARLYADLGRNEDAMDQLDKAAGAAVGSGASQTEGLIRIALGEATEPVTLGEAEIDSVRELAMLLERTSRTEALRHLLADAERLGVPSERLGYPLAAIALRDGDAHRARELLLAESRQVDPVRWHALMARIAEALGDNVMAFAEADAMHLAVPDHSGWTRRGRDYLHKITGLTAAVNAQWASKLVPLAPEGRRAPSFLVGFPRSGTTLLDTFLMGHPEVFVVEEQPMLNAAEVLIGDYAGLPHCTADRLAKARQAYFAELDRHVEAGFGGLVIDKLPLNILGLPLIYAIFPNARVIVAQRHPCDVVLSGFMQGFALNDAMACFLDLEDAARFYDAAMGLFWKARELLPLGIHTLVYEDLVSAPEPALRPLIEFLGLEWRPELLDHQATAQARGAISTPSYTQVVRPLTKAPVGRWRRYEKQLGAVLPTLLPWAARLGYAN